MSRFAPLADHFFRRNISRALLAALAFHLVGFLLFSLPSHAQKGNYRSGPAYVEVRLSDRQEPTSYSPQLVSILTDRPRSLLPILKDNSSVQKSSRNSTTHVVLSGLLAEQQLLSDGTAKVSVLGLPSGQYSVKYVVQVDMRKGKIVWSLLEESLDAAVREVAERVLRDLRLVPDPTLGFVPGAVEVVLRVDHD